MNPEKPHRPVEEKAALVRVGAPPLVPDMPETNPPEAMKKISSIEIWFKNPGIFPLQRQCAPRPPYLPCFFIYGEMEKPGGGRGDKTLYSAQGRFVSLPTYLPTGVSTKVSGLLYLI